MSSRIVIPVVVLLFVGMLVLMAPTLVSQFGVAALVTKVNQGVPGSVSIAELSLSWFGPQRVRGLQLLSAGRDPILQVTSIEADAGLLAFLGPSHCAGTITIDGLQGELEFDATGASNLERAVVAADAPVGAPPPAIPNCRLVIRGSGFNAGAAGPDTIVVQGLEASVDLRDATGVVATIEAQVAPLGAAPGTVSIEVSASGLFAADGSVRLQQAQLKLSSQIHQLPVDLIDHTLAMRGRLTALLGQRLNQEMRAEYADGTGFVRLVTDTSGSATLDLDWTLQDHGIIANTPTQFTLRVTPEAWQQMSASDAVLAEPVAISGLVSRLRMMPGDAGLDARLTISDIEMRHPDAEIANMALRGTELTIASERLSESIVISMNTVAEQARHRGVARLEARLSDLFNDRLAPTPDRLHIDLKSQIEELPLAVFDELLQQGGLLVAALGTQLNASLAGTIDPATQQGELSLSATSKRLNAHLQGQFTADMITLGQGGRLELELQPAVFGRLTKAVSLARPARVEVALERLAIPRDQNGLRMSDAVIGARVASERMDLTRASDGRPINLRGLALKFETERLANGLEAGLDARINGGAFRIAADLPQSTWQDGQLHLSGKSKLVLNADAAAAAVLLPADLRPASSLKTEIAVRQFDLPLANLAGGQVAIDLVISALTFAAGPLDGMQLRDTSASITGTPLGHGVDLVLQTQLAHSGGAGGVAVKARWTGVPEAPALASAQVNINDLPGPALDALAGQHGRLAELLGGAVDADLTVRGQGGGALAFEYSIASPQLKTSGKGSNDLRGLQLQPGVSATLTVTPKLLRALSAASSWSLAEPTSLLLRLDRLSISRGAGDALDIAGLGAQGQLSAARVALLDSAGAPVRLRDLRAGFSTLRLADRLDLDIAAALPGPSANAPDGKIQSTTSLRNLFDGRGAFALADATLFTDTRMDAVPSATVLRLLSQDPALGPALGPVVTASIRGSRPGDLQIEMSGDNTGASIDAHIDPQNTLTLRRDALFELNITPLLVDVYLSKMHPFLHDVQSSQQPVRLSLSQAGFLMPLDHYAPRQIRGEGRLEIGTLIMRRGAATGALTAAMRLMGSQVTERATFPAKFTPLEFSVADGVVRTNDLWMTMEQVVLGSQARLYLPAGASDTILADVLFAVPGRTLQMIPRFGAKIAPDALYEIADSGPVSELAPDFGKLFSSILPSGKNRGQSKVPG